MTGPTEPPPYKPTLFDRHGPAAGDMLRAWAYGVTVFGLCVGAFALAGGGMSLISTLLAAAAGVAVALMSQFLGNLAGGTWKRFAVDGTSTPYKEQYSYQQSLVMAGKLDEALESFEAVIAEAPENVDARMRAAELYARDKGDARRAAELFREIQRIPGVSVGEDLYASNRLVDLLIGPLGEPARALVELRRLIDRYPSVPAAGHARDALARLKQSLPPRDE
jgi:tetratricopeptide (TPR) repeat protein